MDPNRHIPLYKRLKADGFDFQASGHFRENELYFAIPFGVTIQVS